MFLLKKKQPVEKIGIQQTINRFKKKIQKLPKQRINFDYLKGCIRRV